MLLKRFLILILFVMLLALTLPSTAEASFTLSDAYWTAVVAAGLLLVGLVWLIWEAFDDDGPEEAGEMFFDFGSSPSMILSQPVRTFEPVDLSLNLMLTDRRENDLWMAVGINQSARLDGKNFGFYDPVYAGNFIFGYETGPFDCQLRFLITNEQESRALFSLEYEF
jgi:hypothetical protein